MVINRSLRRLSFLIFELDSPSESYYFRSETYVLQLFLLVFLTTGGMISIATC